jgi:peroxiredoxin
MRTALPLALVVALFGLAFTFAPAKPEIGKAAPAFTLKDTAGNTHSLADFEGKFVVLEWLNYDCPFVQKHYDSGNMPALQERYTEQDVVWLSVVSSAPGKQGHFAPAEMDRRTAQAGGNQTAVLMDPTGTVGRAYNAKTTPHMFVIDPEGTLLYMGGIDDVPTANPADLERATNHVAAALDAAMAGEAVPVAVSQPYGCSVKY